MTLTPLHQNLPVHGTVIQLQPTIRLLLCPYFLRNQHRHILLTCLMHHEVILTNRTTLIRLYRNHYQVYRSLPEIPSLVRSLVGAEIHLQPHQRLPFQKSPYPLYHHRKYPSIIFHSLMPPIQRQETNLHILMSPKLTQTRGISDHILNYHWQRPRHQYRSKRWRRS